MIEAPVSDEHPGGEPGPGGEGLSSAAAAQLLREHGPNQLVPEARRPSTAAWAGRALVEPMSLLLLAAGVTYVVLRDTLDAVVAFAALVPTVGVGVALEMRAEHALANLKKLTAPTALVRRDGRTLTIPAEELVPGDLVQLKEGDVVPADAEFLSGTELTVDESALTGESLPVTKFGGGTAESVDLYAGTVVRSGRAAVRIVATGARTRYGAIGSLLAEIKPSPTPLQRVIRKLVGQLAAVAAAFCIAVVAIEVVRGSGWGAAIIAGVSLGIAAVPEEFPMVFTLYLSLGAWRLSRERALVRRLVGVETLGSTTVICTDKTGTLTLGRLEVEAVATLDGSILRAAAPIGPARGLLEAAVLACEPQPFDPLEQAIVRFASARGVEVDALHRSALVRDHPFDPSAKYLSHVWQADGRMIVAAKGAPEGILERSRMSPAERERARGAQASLAGEGMRVIAVASGEAPQQGTRAQDEAALRFAGLVAFSDPLRPGVPEALSDCRDAGIRVVMITGDHPATAHAVADGLGISTADGGATGGDLDRASDEELSRIVERTSVFSRVRPEQKLRLVRALRATGNVVAMTGDGVNDAPALREADIGIAMGERGTDVARESATMVLLDDNFATIVGAVGDGRRIFDNLQRAFAYLIAFHVPLLLGALLIPLLGKPLLLLPIHIVLLELLLHPTVSLVFENDPASPEMMRRPPRPPGRGLLRRAEATGAVARGLGLSIAIVTLYLIHLAGGSTADEARSLAFATLLLGEMWLVLASRAPNAPVWRVPMRGNRALAPVLAGMAAALLVAEYVPAVSHALRLHPLPAYQWLIAAGASAAATLWLEPFKARQAARPAS